MSNAVKNIVGVILYVILLVGTVLGIFFSVKYKKQLDKSTSNDIVLEYVVEIQSLNEEIAELRSIVSKFEGSDISELMNKLEETENKVLKLQRNLELSNAATQTAYGYIQEQIFEIDDLKAEILAYEQALINKEQEMQDALYDAYSKYPDLLGITTQTRLVSSVVYGVVEADSESYREDNIYVPGEEGIILSAGTENNKALVDFNLNKSYGTYLTIESSDSSVELKYLTAVDTTVSDRVTQEGYYEKHKLTQSEGVNKTDRVLEDNVFLVNLRGVYAEDTSIAITIKLYDYADRLVISKEYTLTVQATPQEGFTGLTDDEVQSVANAVKGKNIGTVDTYKGHVVDGNNIVIYFNGKDGERNSVIYRTTCDYVEGYTSFDICNVINTDRASSEQFVYLQHHVLIGEEICQINDSTIALKDILVSHKGVYNADSDITTWTVKCFSIVDNSEILFTVTFTEQGEKSASDIDYALLKTAILNNSNN